MRSRNEKAPTHRRGFFLKLVAGAGFEPEDNNSEVAHVQRDTRLDSSEDIQIDLHYAGKICQELALLVSSWAGLPQAARSKILEIARSSKLKPEAGVDP